VGINLEEKFILHRIKMLSRKHGKTLNDEQKLFFAEIAAIFGD